MTDRRSKWDLASYTAGPTRQNLDTAPEKRGMGGNTSI